ncbi:uncharacterized protein RAG0_01505 [Rhynchosporium agropyri]|uniref:CCHC-type domain-containing protein n=1 Tax=Rhynchosporium agropyri TaxID=914238 RepID=A0A1E1JXG4_9HELO|nr:uncharacterized protein RAG0_01505 [Rhynchosporium agropyri]
MSDVIEPADVAEVRNTQDHVISTEQKMATAQSVDQAMAGVQDALELDSRTSLAGRKRNLQDTYHENEIYGAEGSGERARKRVKDRQDSPLVQEELMTNFTSPSVGGSLPAMAEEDLSYQLPPAREPSRGLSSPHRTEFGASQCPPENEPAYGTSPPLRARIDASDQPSTSEHSEFRLRDTEPELNQATEDHSSLEGAGSRAYETVSLPVQSIQPIFLPRTWNGGVVSSVRTSFGSKPRVSFELKGAPVSASNGQGATARLTEDAVGNSILPAKNVHPSPAAFQELSKEEQDQLTEEEKSHYLKSLFAQLSVPAPSASAIHRSSLLPKSTMLVNEADKETEIIDDTDDTDNADGVSTSFHKISQLPMKSKPFVKLSKTAKKKLSPGARAANIKSHNAYQNEKSEWTRKKNDMKKQQNLLKNAATVVPTDKLRSSTNSEKTSERATSIVAEFKDWVVDDDGKQADLLKRSFTKYRKNNNLNIISLDGDDVESGENAVSGIGEGDIDMDTNLHSTTRQISSSGLPAFSMPTKSERRLNSREERGAYDRAKEERAGEKTLVEAQKLREAKSGQKLLEIELASQKAESVIAKCYPSSGNGIDSEILASMAKGKTLYPRGVARPAHYVNKSGSWDMPELLTIDGRPLQIHEFSWNRFAPYFLSLHPNSWSIFTLKMLVAAFSLYLTHYYSHLQGLDAFFKCRETPTNRRAVKLSKAMDLAKQLLEERPGQNGAPQAVEVTDHSQDLSGPADAFGQNLSVHVDGEFGTAVVDEVKVPSISDEAMKILAAPIDSAEPINPELRQAEIYLQQRYYPSSDLNIVRCLACSQSGHTALHCPLITCKICGSTGVHSEAMCPHKQRCQKCRDRGHQAQDCKEKLSLPISDMSCDICRSSDHLEMACHYVWRSFAPKPEEILTVPEMKVFCYTCGSSGHFGPECGLHSGLVRSGGITWCKANLMRFIGTSSQMPVLPASAKLIPSRVANNGNATDPICIDDSDDEPIFINHQKGLPTQLMTETTRVQPPKQNQQGPSPPKKQKKKGKKKRGAPQVQRPVQVDPNYRRDPNPPRASRPDFSFPRGPIPNNTSPNNRSGPHAASTNNSGGMNSDAHATRGGGNAGPGRGRDRCGGDGLSKADIRRMADQAGGRATRDGF